MADGTDVSLVVVTWNSAGEVAGFLQSLAAHPPGGSWDAVVVDNASEDRTADIVAEVAPWAQLIRNPTNVGLAAANNQGIRATSGDTVVVCNPDVELRPGALDALTDLLARRPQAAFAIARLLHPDGTVQTAAGDLPTLTDALVGRRAATARRGTDGPSGFWWHGWAHDEERRIGHGGEACYAIRRRALEEIGLQDERFVLDWEGIDWFERAGRAGWEVWFCPRAEAVHLGGASVSQAPIRWVTQTHRGMYRYFAPRSPRPLRPLLAAVIAGRGGIKVVATLLGRASYRRAQRPRRRGS